MNKQPLDTAHDADLRLSQQAMQRAALRAHELAAQTGTAIVVSRHGVLELLNLSQGVQPLGVNEPHAPYGKKP